jgi:phosphatidate cytidylyltransferase
MLTRIVSGVIGIGLFLGCCFAGIVPFTIAVVIIAAVASAEFTRGEMLAPPVTNTPIWAAGWAKLFRIANPVFTCMGVALVPMAYAIAIRSDRLTSEIYISLIVLAVLAGLALVARAWSTGTILGWFRAFYGKAGFWYVGGTFSSFILLRALPGRIRVGSFAEADRGAWIMLCVAVCVWSTDTFAYFTGKALGKNKLAPKLSPGKTIEGFAGGLAGSVVAGVLFAHWIGLMRGTGSVIGAIAGIIGPLGDLFESGLKRELGIKDFGNLMPGHGGVLDRFDSLMFVAPIAYLYLVVFVR